MLNDDLDPSIGRGACYWWFHCRDCSMEMVSLGSCNCFWYHTADISLSLKTTLSVPPFGSHSSWTFVYSVILSETYHPILLRQKAARIRKQTGNPHVTTQYDLLNSKKTSTQVIIENLTRPFVLLFTNQACFCIGVYMAICNSSS